MDDLYRDEILEHYRNPHNFGTLDEPTLVKEGSNPLCGDRITLMLAISNDGTVEDVTFTGRGCAISQASASMLTDRMVGEKLTDLASTTREDIMEMLGVEVSYARIKCATLSLGLLRQALAEAGVSVSEHMEED
jgi:nitrogen fixation NifU-like protein